MSSVGIKACVSVVTVRRELTSEEVTSKARNQCHHQHHARRICRSRNPSPGGGGGYIEDNAQMLTFQYHDRTGCEYSGARRNACWAQA